MDLGQQATDSKIDIWSYNETLMLVKNIKPHNCLWDPRHVDYQNEELKRSIILNIINALNIHWLTESKVIEKIALLKRIYHTEYNKTVLYKSYKSPYYWYKDADSFMKDAVNTTEWSISTTKKPKHISNMGLLEFALDIWSDYASLDMKGQRQFRQNMQTILNEQLDKQ